MNERKVQLAIFIIFLNYITDDTAEKYILSDNNIIRPTDDTNEITANLYNTLLHRYQETLENKMEGSRFVFDYINFPDIKFNNTDLVRGVHILKKISGYQIEKQLSILKIIKMMIITALCTQLLLRTIV